MQRITGLPDEQVAAFEVQIEAVVRAALAQVMDTIARRIEASMPTVASSNVEHKERVLVGSLPFGGNGFGIPIGPQGTLVGAVEDVPPDVPGQPYVSPDDLASIPPLWQEAVAEQVLPIAAQVFLSSVGKVHADMIDASSIAGLPSVGSLAAEQYLAQASNTFDQIGDHLWATARQQLSEGFEAGESIPQLAERLRGSAEVTARTGVLVARTQVIEASNAGSFAVAQASGLQMKKFWIATDDLRTRPEHLDAESNYGPGGTPGPIDLNQPFIVGGYSAMFPAASSLPPSMRYNCRCTPGYVMPDKAPGQVRAQDALDQQIQDLPGTSGIDDIAAQQSARLKAIIDQQHADVEAAIEDVHRRFGETFGREAGPGFDLPARGEHPQSYIRPSLVGAKTPRELRRVWQDEVQAITGHPFLVDRMPTGVSMVTAREYAEGTLQMFAQFPEARIDRIHWFDDAASSSYAQVRRGGHAIEFNMRYASEKGRPKFLEARRRDAAGWDSGDTSWGVRNDRNGQGVVYHEFTHILDIENAREAIHGKIVPLLIQHAQREGITDIDDLIKRRISSYATKNYQEMVAEAGADVMVNGAAASQLSRDIFDLLRAEYRARGFGLRTGPVGEVFPKAAGPVRKGEAAAKLPPVQARITAKNADSATWRATGFDGLPSADKEAVAAVTKYLRQPGFMNRRLRFRDDPSQPIHVQTIDELLGRAPADQVEAARALAGVEADRLIAAMDRVMARSLLPDSAELWRGVELKALGPDLPVDLVGLEWTDLGFVSTSATRSVAEGSFSGSQSAVMRIMAPPGTPALGFEGLGEAEVLLGRGLRFRVTADRGVLPNGARLLDVEVAPSPSLGEVFPKAAGPRAVSSMTVKDLRDELKARGVTVPVNTRKPDLVRMVEDQRRAVPGAPGPAVGPLSLAARVKTKVVDLEPLPGGKNATVQLATFEDGTQAVKKTARVVEGRSAKLQQDAEEIEAKLLDAFGIRAPETVRVGPRVIFQERIPGTVADDLPRVPGSHDVAGGYYESDEGRIIGLVDALTDNYDRNAGNWIVTPDGHLAGIDHGFAFQWKPGRVTEAPFSDSNLFNRHLSSQVAGRKGEWVANDYSPADMATARQILESMRPEFERLGHRDWYDRAVERLGYIEQHATGTAVRITPRLSGPAPTVIREIAEAPPLSRAPLVYQARQDALRADAARPVIEGTSRRMSGESAYTTRVEHQGGPPTITKDYSRADTSASGKRNADAEELGSLVDDAVGLRAPTVIRTGPRSIEQEFLEGRSGDDLLPWPHTITDELVNSDEGRLMGLSDLLLGDTDRRAGNFIRLADGRLAPIDRGSAFAAPKLAGAKDPFGAYFAPDGKWRKVIDVNPADLAVIRTRLEALRPEFERLGRATWHRQVMARLAEVEKRADPAAAIRLAEARPDLAAIRTGQRGIATQAEAIRMAPAHLDRVPISEAAERSIQLTAQQKRALMEYASSSEKINAAIRAGRTESKTVAAIDEAMAQSRLTSDVEVWRGVKTGRGVFGDRLSGDVTGFDWTEQTYVSTSTDRSVAEGFAIGDRPTVMRIVAPKDTGGIAISPYGGRPRGQAEILLQRGLHMRVTRDHGIVPGAYGDVRLLDVEIVPETSRVAQRAAVRTRAGEISTQRANAALIARVDELVQAKASKAVIRQELDPALREAEQLYAGADKAVADALRTAVDSGDAAKIRAALTRQSKANGLTPIGRAGAKAKFDPATMEGIGGTAIPDGADVIVVRRGAKLAGIETPERAIVRLAPTKALPPLRPGAKLTVPQFDARIRAARVGDDALASPSMAMDSPAFEALPAAQRRALAEYRGAGFEEFNTELRGRGVGLMYGQGPRDIIERHVRQLDDVFDASRLSDDVVLYRAPGPGREIFGDPDTWGSDLAGFTWRDDAYSSATVSERVAGQFGVDGGVRLRIFTPRGTKAVKMSDLTEGPDVKIHEEGEIVLGRGASYRVVRDRGWVDVASRNPVTGAPRTIRVRDLDVEVTVPDVTPEIPWLVRPASTAKTVTKGDFTGLTRTSEAMGGNPGGIFEAGDGSRWYVKTASTAEHARSEALALDLYRAAGLDAPELIIGEGVEGLGRRQIATRFLDDAQVDLRARLANDPAYIAQVQDGFATDAWLANWDVVGANPAPGMGWDNIVSVGGRPVRIEAGGALRFRGLGGDKPFGDDVLEFDTLRDTATGRRSGAVFGDMTPEQLIASAERVRKVTPAKIKALVKKHGLDPELADTLIARRADILRRAEALAGPKPMTVREFNAAIKAAAKKQEALDAVPFSTSGRVYGPGYQQDAVDRYRVASDINDALRGKTRFGTDVSGAHYARDIHEVDAVFDGSRLTSDVELWRSPGSGRGIFGNPATWGDDLTGFEWVDPAYSSTSASRTVADRFTKDGGVRLRVIAPKGSKAIQLSEIEEEDELSIGVSYTDEAEILLGRGARYRVVRDRGWTTIKHPTTHQTIRVRDLDVEVVVPGETPPLPWATK